MITGVLLMLAVESLLFGSWPIAGWMLLFFLVHAVYLARMEEPGLERRFGEDHRCCKTNVPRRIPRASRGTRPGRATRRVDRPAFTASTALAASRKSPMKSFIRFPATIITVTALLATALPATAQQPLDEEYTALIREYTTETFFSTPLVDHLPFSETVPTPLDHLGHISGAPDILSHPDEVHGYMRALAAASPRVEVFQRGGAERADAGQCAGGGGGGGGG